MRAILQRVLGVIIRECVECVECERERRPCTPNAGVSPIARAFARDERHGRGRVRRDVIISDVETRDGAVGEESAERRGVVVVEQVQ